MANNIQTIVIFSYILSVTRIQQLMRMIQKTETVWTKEFECNDSFEEKKSDFKKNCWMFNEEFASLATALFHWPFRVIQKNYCFLLFSITNQIKTRHCFLFSISFLYTLCCLAHSFARYDPVCPNPDAEWQKFIFIIQNSWKLRTPKSFWGPFF